MHITARDIPPLGSDSARGQAILWDTAIQVTTFFVVVPNIFSVMTAICLLLGTLPAHRIWRWLLDFWKSLDPCLKLSFPCNLNSECITCKYIWTTHNDQLPEISMLCLNHMAIKITYFSYLLTQPPFQAHTQKCITDPDICHGIEQLAP